MCKKCILLGALFNASEMDCFPCKSLSKYDFHFSVRDDHLIDKRAAVYLKDTIEIYRQAGIELIPVQVDSDGSCLPHSISRSLMGVEVFYDCLRASLRSELLVNKTWYRTSVPSLQIYDDEEFERIYPQLVDAAAPTRGQIVGREKYLEGIHILALANVLMRPILLLDTPNNMAAMAVGEVSGCGMYLPLRHTRSDIEKALGRSASPLIIGWTSPAKDHYCALALRLAGEVVFANALETYPEALARMLTAEERARHEKFLQCVRHCPPEMAEAMGEFVFGPPVIRDKSAETLIKIIENLNSHLEYLTGEHRNKCSFKESNRSIQFSVIRVVGALALLRLVGFEPRQTVTGEKEFVCVRALDPTREDARQQTVVNLELIQSLRRFTTGELHGIPFPKVPVFPLNAEPQLFGAAPILAHLLVPADGDVSDISAWEEARKRYGEGIRTDSPGITWSFGTGEDGTALVTEMKLRAFRSLQSLARGTDWHEALQDARQTIEFGIDELTTLGTEGIGAQAKCPVCSRFVWFDFPRNYTDPYFYLDNLMNPLYGLQDITVRCSNCWDKGRLTTLSVSQCLYVKVLKWIKDLFAEDSNHSLARELGFVDASLQSCSLMESVSAATEDSIPLPETRTSPDYSRRLWACEHRGRDGKRCGIANLREEICCFVCHSERLGVTLAEREQYNARKTAAEHSATELLAKRKQRESSILKQYDELAKRARAELDRSMQSYVLIFETLLQVARESGIARSQDRLEKIASALQLQLDLQYLNNAATKLTPDAVPRKIARHSSEGREIEEALKEWDCPHCTFKNSVQRSICSMCSISRDDQPSWQWNENSDVRNATGAASAAVLENFHSNLAGNVTLESQHGVPEGHTTTVDSVAFELADIPPSEEAQGADESEQDLSINSGDHLGPQRPVRIKRSPSESGYHRLYAVVKESYPVGGDRSISDDTSLLSKRKAFDGETPSRSTNGSALQAIVGNSNGHFSPTSRTAEADESLLMSPATPSRMYRQASAPVTVSETRQAEACISPQIRSERNVWDQCWIAVHEA